MHTLIIEHAEDRAENFAYFIKQTGSSLTIWRPYLEKLPKVKFDHIILTGGPMSTLEIYNSQDGFFQDEIKFIKSAIQNNIPILGVCLGFQLLAYLLGGKLVFKQPRLKGWFNQKLTPLGRKDSLFKNIPESFVFFEYHQDQVIKLPPNTILLASSESCPIEAFKVKNKPIWGIQFHPEISIEKAKEILMKTEKDFDKYDSKLATIIFGNFIFNSK